MRRRTETLVSVKGFWVSLSALSFVIACGASRQRTEDLSLRIIGSGDALYQDRVDPRKLDQAIQWYLSGSREFSDSGQMLGRLARAYVAKSYGFPVDGVDGFATARQFGLACLKTEASFGGLLSSTGGEITTKAIASLQIDRVDCMTWTSIAWSRWLAERGVVGAGIDLGATTDLARRAVKLQADYDGGRPYAALGLALALPPSPLEPRLGAARKALKQAQELSPTRLTPVVDLAEFVSAPQGKNDEWLRLLERVARAQVDPEDPDLLENQAAIARAKALLKAGPSDRWMK